MATQVIDETITITESATIILQLGGFLGWGIDINVASTEANGVVKIQTQNTDPVGDLYSANVISQYTLVDGQFDVAESGITRKVLDSNNVTNAYYLIINWVGTDLSDGTLQVKGYKQIF